MNRNHLAPLAYHSVSSMNLPPWVRLIDGDGTDQGAPPAPATGPQAGQQRQPVPTPPPAPPAGQGAPVNPHGYPENTPLAEMTAEQRESYWKYHARKHETAAQAAARRVAELEPVAARAAELEEATKTAEQKALEAARTAGIEEGKAAAEQAVVSRFAPALLQAKFESALAGRMASEQVSAVVSALNVAAFLGADGLPDPQKVTDYVATAFPPQASPPGQQPPPRDLGGGRPQGHLGGEDMAAVFDRRHPKAKVPTQFTF